MALAYVTKAAIITLTLIDEYRKKADKTFIVRPDVWEPTTGLWADLETIRNSLVTEYAPLTQALILKATVSIIQQDDTSLVGPAGSDLGNAASLTLNLHQDNKQMGYIIPAAADGIFSGSTGTKNFNIVDVADADLLAFTELLSQTDGSFEVSDGEYTTDTSAEQVDSGKRISQKRKNP